MTPTISGISVVNFRSLPVNRQERRRKLIVRLVFVIYWLLILEGVLRKWVVPHFSRELFFIRDPFVLWVYCVALIGRMRPQRSIFLIVGLIFSLVCIPLAVLQFINSPYVRSWILSAYGWRNYFFYLPLAFLIAKYFRPQEFERLMRWTLLLAIPIAMLVFLQFRSPAYAPINQGTGTGEEAYNNPGVAFSLVRTYGTFTSGPGQGAFIGSVVAMLLALWLRPTTKRPLRGIWLLAASAGGACCLALSGSRGEVVAAGIIFVAAIAAALLISGRNLALQKIFIPILLLVVGVLLAPLVFPKAVDAFITRWQTAGYAETEQFGRGGIFSRAIYEIGSFRFLLGSTPAQGYQLGIGGNAGGAISKSKTRSSEFYDSRLLLLGVRERQAIESDWGRQIAELGPVLGLLFIVFRLAFVIWLGKESVAATVRSNDPLPLVLFAFIGLYLFYGQITGHGSLNGYAWLFAGFCMSINRRRLDGSVAEQMRPLRRFKRSGSVTCVGREPQIARS
jgi:hypothetical protein